jgi:hypothetical protein
MPNSVTVTLAERQYVIKELPRRKNMAWRQALKEPFGDLVDALTNAPALEIDSTAELQQLADLVRTLTSRVIGSIDLMCELLFDYSPSLAEDRDRIEEEGYDSEIVGAFAQVLQLAFPFGQIINLAARAIKKAGQQAQRT